MGIIYLLSYFESFNHDYLVKLFQFQPFSILAKELKNKTDNKKLTMTFKEIIISDIEGLDSMAEKMYSEIFNYHKLGPKVFIKKLLDTLFHIFLIISNRND